MWGVRTDLPTGTVTFLFTDIEGSTRLLHELGAEAYADALAEVGGRLYLSGVDEEMIRQLRSAGKLDFERLVPELRKAAANWRLFSTGTALSSTVCQIKHGGVSFVTCCSLESSLMRSAAGLPAIQL